MGRPKEFDRGEVLERAMEVFWTHGFEVTSMSDLQRALGIGRQSLYDTFGDRKAIFDEALGHYVARSNARNDVLLEVDDGLEAVRNYFDDSIRGFGGSGPSRGVHAVQHLCRGRTS
jgi:AcrR family transcriptional regulator